MLGFSLNPIDWVKDAASDVVGGAFDFLANWISDALSWLAGQLMGVILGAGAADISDRFSELGGPSGIVLWLGLASVVVGLIGADDDGDVAQRRRHDAAHRQPAGPAGDVADDVQPAGARRHDPAAVRRGRRRRRRSTPWRPGSVSSSTSTSACPGSCG